MTFSQRTHRRWIRKLALGLSVVALGAVAVPGASGSFPDGEGSASAVGAATLPSAQFPTLAQLEQFRFDGPESQPVRPDDRGARPVIVSGPATTPGPITDGLGRPLIPEVRPATRPVAVVTPTTGPDGVDWPAVGVGAGLGLILLVAGGVALIVTRRRGTMASA
jgi:hypothetical protein